MRAEKMLLPAYPVAHILLQIFNHGRTSSAEGSGEGMDKIKNFKTAKCTL